MYKIERILQSCCAVVGLPRSQIELSVKIVSSAVMRKLNKTYRGKDETTDVLSFPMLTRQEISTLKKKRGMLPLGDIFINRTDARKRLFSLVVHGFLHLAGYDHNLK